MTDLDREERDKKIVEMRKRGMIYREIGKRFGLSYESVRLICARAHVGKQVRAHMSVYPAINKWMRDNGVNYSDFYKLASKTVYKPKSKYQLQQLCYILKGLKGPSMQYIRMILAVTGLTFEEAFRLDEETETQV